MQLWKLIHPHVNLFRYIGNSQAETKPCKPILMLHGTLASHRTWQIMAERFWEYGIEGLYAIDMPELQSSETIPTIFEQLTQAIHILLNEHPEHDSVVLVGHGAGGIVAYRYWQAFEEEAKVAFLFMLASPHNTSVYPWLYEETVASNQTLAAKDLGKSTQSPAVEFTKVKAVQGNSSTVLVNIIGKQIEPDFDSVVRGLQSFSHDDRMLSQAVGNASDGVVQGFNLPEAVNWILPLHPPLEHRDMNKDNRVFEAILSCLRGEHYRVMLKPVAIRLVGDDGEGFSGPIAFEINGNRMPPDSVFHGVSNRLYIFDENVSPVCTLSYPVGQMSGTLILHLKDLSDQHGRRRRMYVRLHVPLREVDKTTHTMQDSEGSDFLWRLICQQMPSVLIDSALRQKSKEIPRGI